MKDQYYEKAQNDLVNFITCVNYSDEFKLEYLDDLVKAYKFQLERAIKEQK